MANTHLILGTAQLGMDYGVANPHGKPDDGMAMSIVNTAWQGGVREFDTAIGYGESEVILGRIFKELDVTDQVLVNSKPDHTWDGKDIGVVDHNIDTSLDRLGVPHLHTLLLHRESLLDQWEPTLGNQLARIKSDGRIKNIGISVYSPEAAIRAVSLDEIDVVQIPTNFLDRRFEQAGVAKKAAEKGKLIQIRSIFLQGLIFLTPKSLPAQMKFAANEVEKVASMMAELKLSPLETAMGYIRQAWPDSAVLFGAETVEQVQDNLAAFSANIPDNLSAEVQDRFPAVSEKILNPALWGA